MSDSMRIDHAAVTAAAEQVEAVADDLDTAAIAVSSESSEAVSSISLGEFSFRTALNSAESWWYTRVVDHRNHLLDLAQFMATNAATAAQYDEDAASDMVELDAELEVDVTEYSTNDYYAATGAERPSYNPDAIPTAGGQDVAV
jgi:hypothetical protein